MKRYLVLGALLWLPASLPAQSTQSVAGVGTAEDRAAVVAAANDYIEGFYQGDTTRLVRSVARDVHKYGYARRPDGYVGMQMPYAAFLSFAEGVRNGRNTPPAGAPKEVTVFEVQDQTANVKITAWWGIDYLLLAKREGKWMITHVIWQSPPPRNSASR